MAACQSDFRKPEFKAHELAKLSIQPSGYLERVGEGSSGGKVEGASEDTVLTETKHFAFSLDSYFTN